MSQDPSDSECNALNHFSMSLAHKYVNIKEPYNQDIKEQVINKSFKKRRQALNEIPNLRDIVCKRCFSNSVPYLWC